VSATTLLLIFLALLAVPVTIALTQRDAPARPDEEDQPDVDVVVDLEFLRARPAELDQRISELVALSGEATLGARMRTVQLAEEPVGPRPVRVRRRTRPLVASR
jgi:hypothetical protein